MRYNAQMLAGANFFGRSRLFFQLILLLGLLISFSLGSAFRQDQLYKNLPLVKETAVFSLTLPSPKPNVVPLPAIASKSVENTTVEKKVLGGSVTSDSLCRGQKNSWTMVPDPNHEGLYTICNVTTEKMATIAELNVEQNNYRVAHNLNALNINSGLCKIAGERAEEISKNFSHDGFQAAIERSGLDKHSFGENIASGPLDAVHFVEWSWDRSPGHKANMLGDWTDGCAGVFDKYAVFLFAK